MDRLDDTTLRAMADGRARGFKLIETELTDVPAHGPKPQCIWFRAIVLDTLGGQHWAIRFRSWTNDGGRTDGHQQPTRVQAVARTLRFWEDQ